MSKHIIAAYGTLRKGFYNHDRFDGVKYLGTTRIKGFDLYNLGPYPCVVKNPEGELTIDLLEVTPITKTNIDRMEIGAGYGIEEINIELDGNNYHDVTIYTYNTKQLGNAKLIASGDYTSK